MLCQLILHSTKDIKINLSILKPNIPKETTLERLIEDLDQRGLLVFLVLLGQQAMNILSEEHSKTLNKTKILLPIKDKIT